MAAIRCPINPDHAKVVEIDANGNVIELWFGRCGAGHSPTWATTSPSRPTVAVYVAEAKGKRVQKFVRRNRWSRPASFQPTLAVGDVEEDGNAGEVFEDAAIGGEYSDVLVGRWMVENEAGAVEPTRADGGNGQEGVIDRPEAVGHDDGDGQAKFRGEIGDVVIAG